MTTRIITTILFSLTAIMIVSSNIGAYAATATPKAKASDSMATQAAKAEVKKKLSAKNALKAKKNDKVLPH
jgi:hypothetical protein